MKKKTIPNIVLYEFGLTSKILFSSSNTGETDSIDYSILKIHYSSHRLRVIFYELTTDVLLFFALFIRFEMFEVALFLL